MKITEIRIDRTKSLGNYENLKLGFTVVVDDGEDAAAAVEQTKRLLDWEINRDEREAQYLKYREQLATGTLNGKSGSVERWIKKFETAAAEFAPELIIAGPAEPGSKSNWNNANTKI
jgi:hypothetical protein